jgi:hypothetical protein
MSYSIETMISDLEKEFENVFFSFKEINYQGKLPCFSISVKSENELAKIWVKVSDIIAVNYQSRMTDEFSIWNLYLFFIVNEPISNNLKYQIENDTFSSRKIVIEGKSDFTKIIEKHILNSDVKVESSDSDSISKSDFIPNSTIYLQLKDIELRSKRTNAITDAYSQIVKKIKEKYHEI